MEGKESIFYIKYNNEWFPISCETSSPMTENVEMVNTTTRDNQGWKTEKPTIQSYSFQIEAVLVDDMDQPFLSYHKIRSMKRNRTLIEWQRKLLNGVYIDKGKAYITSISDSNSVDETITFSLTLNGFGKPLEDTDVQYILGEDSVTIAGDKNNNLIEAE